MKGRILARVVSLIAVFSMICGIFPGGVLTVHAAEYSLASLSQDFKATNGSVLTGTLGANHKISIADGATVTLKDATIKKVGDGDTDYPGITCMGDATIILEGENTVEAFAYRYPGIYIPDGNTLTIQGTGTLNVTGKQGCGIGGGLDLKKSGNVLIKGGTIIAEGGYYCAAIGQAVRGQCGDITITGGDVTARGGDSAAGIGAKVRALHRIMSRPSIGTAKQRIKDMPPRSFALGVAIIAVLVSQWIISRAFIGSERRRNRGMILHSIGLDGYTRMAMVSHKI